jgi:RNA polymerase sigma-70 factor (ECF subfamily)
MIMYGAGTEPCPMTGDPEQGRSPLDADVRRLLLAGRARDAADLLLARLSPEIRPFLYRLLGDVALADEAHSATSERLWRGLTTFRWECSLRSWSYIIARREANRCRARQQRAAAAETTLSAADDLPARSAPTSRRFSTTQSDVLEEVRASLSDEDRDLLVMRVERGLAWKEIALAFLAEEAPGAKSVNREAARLRQRFRSIRSGVTSAMTRAKPKDPEPDEQ